MIDRSPQFELKLLTKFLLINTQRLRIIPFLTVGVRKRYAFRIQPDCQTSAHPTHDFAKVDYMPASKAVRLQSKQPWTKVQPVTGRLDYNQKIGNLKEVLQKGGYRDFSRKLLPVPRLAANPTLTTPAQFAWRLLPSITLTNRSPQRKPYFQAFSAATVFVRPSLRRQNQSTRRNRDLQAVHQSFFTPL
jgi:hypothetical protein